MNPKEKLESLEIKKESLKQELISIRKEIQSIEYGEVRKMVTNNIGSWFNCYGRYFKILSVTEEDINVLEVSFYEGRPTIEFSHGHESEFREKDLLGEEVPEKVSKAFNLFKNQIQ